MSAKIRIEIEASGLQLSAYTLTSTGAVVTGAALVVDASVQRSARVTCLDGAGYLTWDGIAPAEDHGHHLQAGDAITVRIGNGQAFKWLEDVGAQSSVLPPFSRVGTAAEYKFTPQAAYATAGMLIGGKLAVDFGRPSTVLRLCNAGLSVPMANNAIPGSGAALIVFKEDPGAAFTDGALPNAAAWGAAKIHRGPSFGFVWGPAGGKLATYATQTTAWPMDVATDAGGKIYMAILMNPVQWDTPGEACLTVPYLY